MKEKKLIAFDLYDTCFSIENANMAYRQLFFDLWVSDKKRELRKILLTSNKSIEEILSDIFNHQKNEWNEVLLDDWIIPTTWEILNTNEMKWLKNSKAVVWKFSSQFPQWTIRLQLNDFYKNLRNEIDSVSLFPEVTSVLSELKNRGYKIAAISNLAQPYIEPLNILLPHVFHYEVLSCEVWLIKPDKKIFDCLKNISWYHEDQILMVGDSFSSDVQWAKGAGIAPVHLNRNSEWIKYCDAYISISTLQQLLEIL